MRKHFPGYYRPSNADFDRLWKECFFCFDTNVLLNLYKYKPTTQSDMLAILATVKDRMWLTNQAASEYLERRLTVIQQQAQAYTEIIELLEKSKNSLTTQVKKYSRHASLEAEATLDPLQIAYDVAKAAIEEAGKAHPDLVEKDSILSKLTALFDGRVGDRPPPDEIQKMMNRAEERTKKQIPPGYMDEHKGDDRQYGDTILWLQLLDEVAKRKKPIILVTDDLKEDWWLKHNGKTLGPRPELINEVHDVAKVAFYMYSTETFLSHAGQHLGKPAKKETIDDVEAQKRLTVHEQHLVDLLMARLDQTDSIKKRQRVWTDVFESLEQERSQLNTLIRERDEARRALKNLKTIGKQRGQDDLKGDPAVRFLRSRIAELSEEILDREQSIDELYIATKETD